MHRPPLHRALRVGLAIGLVGSHRVLAADIGAGATQGASAAQDSLAPVTVQATAIPGASIDADLLPGNVQTVSAADISRHGDASLTGALDRDLSSINVNDNLDDPYQPDLLYRGFEASPVLGTPEGLAVYENGVRINEAFGDAVNWDLIPSQAVDRVSIVSSSPVYGLNALGAGVAVTMKNGFSYQGGDVLLYGGSFNQRAAAAQYGVSGEHFGVYVSADALDEGGWREFAQDSIRRLYAVISEHVGIASFDLSYSGAKNGLDGQGSAPQQELAISPYLVFTGPQVNLNTLNFLTLDASFALSDTLGLQSVFYDRQYDQTVANGDNTDYINCTHQSALCQSDGLTPLTNAAGQLLPDITDSDALIIGENDFERITAYGRGAALQISDSAALGGHDNHFSAGASYDYASMDFYSGTQIGVLDTALTVLPSDLIVDTPESSPWEATPVSLQAFNKDAGLFVTDTFNVTRALAATLSGRYNVADLDLYDRLGTALTGDNRYEHFNPALGATWRVLPTTTTYVGFSENARAPTASEIECANPLQPCLLPSNLASDPPTLRQVVSQTFELGLRGQLAAGTALPGSLTWNAGVFRTHLHDDIYGIATTVYSGFFQNIGATRRRGAELGLHYVAGRWLAHLDYSYIDATFQSALMLPSPANPYQDTMGNIQVVPGDRLPGMPANRAKLGAEYRPGSSLSVGADLEWVGSSYFFGDESNQNPQLAGYAVVDLYGSYDLSKRMRLFATIDNLFNSHYATYGTYGDPTGVNAPGVPLNGEGVNYRFESPAEPFALYGGIKLTL